MSQASFDTRGQLRRSSFGESGRLLTERLNDLRRSRLNIGAVTALLWGAAAFAVIMLASVWVDVVLNLSPMLRVLAWISAFAVLCGVGFRIYVRTKNAAHASSLAKQLDETTGSGGEIR